MIKTFAIAGIIAKYIQLCKKVSNRSFVFAGEKSIHLFFQHKKYLYTFLTPFAFDAGEIFDSGNMLKQEKFLMHESTRFIVNIA